MDGGLERLVTILHSFCLSPPPPPPQNGSLIYGLRPPSNPNKPLPPPTPTLNPASFDKHAAYRFSLAFQCVVNIGVRGSEPIRARVVQAGTLEVVGCVLEAWLAGKGFAVGPSASATGMPRETREQRQARRDAMVQLRQRQQEQAEFERQRSMPRHDLLLSASNPVSDTEMSEVSETSAAPTPVDSGTPTGSVVFPSRDRSGTIIARREREREQPTSRPETETEDEDVDMDRERSHHHRAVGIISDDAPPVDTHIIINTNESGDLLGVGAAFNVNGNGAGVEDGIVSFEAEANDDFAMGAPPGAPGAIALGIGMGISAAEGESEDERERRSGDESSRTMAAPDATPRPGVIGLPPTSTTETSPAPQQRQQAYVPSPPQPAPPATAPAATTVTTTPSPTATAVPHRERDRHHRHHHHSHSHSHSHSSGQDLSGPYRDEDVLLSLQLLAYLSKYPHVRQAFYKPRTTFHPASVDVVGGRWGRTAGKQKEEEGASAVKEKEGTTSGGFFRSLRGKDREAAPAPQPAPQPQTKPRQTNVFSLVERFTFKPSSSETALPNPPPRLPPEIQYWAGVVMRNACRKDEGRGGIRHAMWTLGVVPARVRKVPPV
ncbi:hypothetical protein H0H87_003059 [Tephrocybe sp. NHM501043]|nr:hypothetical protein H0H87_003059 [Tephrocybe sp. NHM501043]